MRWMLLLFVAGVLGNGLLWSAEVPNAVRPQAAPLNPGEAQNYGQQLYYVLTNISQQYAKPITPQELAQAALSGLYEEIRQPVPPTLFKDIEKAQAEHELLGLLIRTRGDIGDVEELRGMKALLISFRSLTKVLDPFSVVVDGRELRRSTLEERHQGFGLEVSTPPGSGFLVIDKVIPGSPAQRAGLRPGDQITHFDGRIIGETEAFILRNNHNYAPDDLQATTRIRLTVRRLGRREPLQATLSWENYKAETIFGHQRAEDNSWLFFLDKKQGIAHVRVGSLEHGTSEDLRQVLRSLRNDGLRGLVLDLRGCPGGFLNEAYLIARMFLKEDCLIAAVKYRNREADNPFRSIADEEFTDIPLVVLVGEETSGGAELIAAALQDNRRAVIAGQRTRGKASVQTILSLPVADAGFKLTTGNFYRPNGKSLHRFSDSKPSDDWGIRPEPKWNLPISSDLTKQLAEWWHLQTLRPGTDKEALPLDDPESDPQRQLALQALMELLEKD